jgi:hypothetical protein
MRRRRFLRRSRARTALAAAALVVPALGAGLAEAATSADSGGSSPHNSIQIKVTQRRVGYRQQLTVTGRTSSGAAGRRVRLDFAPAGTNSWRPVGHATVGRSNQFRIQARLRRSGRVKVRGMWSPGAGAPSGNIPSQGPAPPGSASQPTSDSHRVKVTASFHLARHATDEMGSRPITVQGTLLPVTRGRRVRLQTLSAHRWQNLAQTRTGAQGRFHFRYHPGSGKHYLRVSFGGDRSNAANSARSGSVTVFNQGVASWYQDGGTTACGFHAYYGVANVSLPCGTRVTFLYHGHRVTATVDDRGPYVGGRTWDLNQNTAGALGFGGVANVWASR